MKAAAISAVLLIAGQILLVAGFAETRVSNSVNRSGVGIAVLSADSGRYLEQSSSWSALADAPWNYASYLLVLRLGHWLGAPETVALTANVIFSVLAGAVLLTFCAERAGIGAGLIAASLLLLNPLVSQWLRFVLIDSIFISVIALTVIIIIRILEDDRCRPRLLLSVLALTVWAMFLKPHGLLLFGLVGSLLSYQVLRMAPKRSWRGRIAFWTVVALPWVVVPFLLAAGASSYASIHTDAAVQSSGLVANYYRGLVQSYDPPILISMPPAGDVADVSAAGLLTYVLNHPAAVLRLIMARVASALLQMRDHYPSSVNYLLGSFMLGYLISAAFGYRTTRDGPLRTVPVVFFLGFLGLVGVTWSVAEGRYGWYGLAALIPLSALGVLALVERATDLWTRPSPNHRE